MSSGVPITWNIIDLPYSILTIGRKLNAENHLFSGSSYLASLVVTTGNTPYPGITAAYSPQSRCSTTSCTTATPICNPRTISQLHCCTSFTTGLAQVLCTIVSLRGSKGLMFLIILCLFPSLCPGLSGRPLSCCTQSATPPKSPSSPVQNHTTLSPITLHSSGYSPVLGPCAAPGTRGRISTLTTPSTLLS
jgi:hypothetical protein